MMFFEHAFLAIELEHVVKLVARCQLIARCQLFACR
jgi:hypothetical protein